MTRWKLVVESGPVFRFSIREEASESFIGREIATVNPYNIIDRQALGHLIAAAPEMLNALISNVDMLHRIKRELANPMPEVEHALNVALAAIAKVEGRL